MESTIDDLVAADAALPGMGGLRDEDCHRLVAALMAGLTWDAATAAVFSGRPQKLVPRPEALAAWRSQLERLSAAGGGEPVLPDPTDWRHGSIG